VFLWKAYFDIGVQYVGEQAKQILCVNVALSLNLAWVGLAAIMDMTNTVFNDKLDWTHKENRLAIGGPDFAMGVIGFHALVAVYLCITRGDFVFALASSWAFWGIAGNQAKDSLFSLLRSDKLELMATVSAQICMVAAAVALVRMTVSAWHTWHEGSQTSDVEKVKEGSDDAHHQVRQSLLAKNSPARSRERT